MYCPRTFCPCSCSFFVTCIKYILDYSVRPICLPWTRKLVAHIFSDIIYMDSRCFGARLNLGPRNKTWLLVIVAIPPHLINWSTHWILKSPTHCQWCLTSSVLIEFQTTYTKLWIICLGEKGNSFFFNSFDFLFEFALLALQLGRSTVWYSKHETMQSTYIVIFLTI
jgi:hypothetical protein